MIRLELPRNLVEAARRWGPPERREWIADLPALVGDVAERWDLAVGPPFQPGGQCSWVAPVRDAAGRDLVLKVGWRCTEAEHEADALRAWAGRGAVAVHASEADERTITLLLERCDPGTPLADATPVHAQDVVVAGLLRRLWVEPAAGHPFRPLQVMCDEWADEHAEKLAAAPGALDPGLAAEGMTLFRELPRSADREVLLATDLHAENVLAARREPWLVVDPNPYVGDPAYDPLQHLLNSIDLLAADPLGRVRRMAGLLDLDVERVRLWMFARCVQEGIDAPELVAVARALAP